MSDVIKHSGKIISIDNDIIKIEIESNAACGSCYAKKMCGMSESEKKIISIKTKKGYQDNSNINPTDLMLGQEVQLGITTTAGLTAALMSYFYPFLILIGTLILVIKITENDLLAILISFLAVVLYYLLLKKFSNKNQKIRFFIIES